MNNSSHQLGEPAHVVHVIGALRTGGAEKMLINFLGAVDKQRFRHTVICLSARGEMAADAESHGVPVVLFAVRMRYILRDVNKLAKWFRQHDVAIVHSHMFFASFWARLAGLRAGVRVMVTTEHGKEPWKKKWQSLLDRLLSRKTWHHIAVSEDVRNIRISRDGIHPDRISVIPNGVPIPREEELVGLSKEARRECGLANDATIIGSVGRMIEAKAYPDLLRALAIARKEVPSLHWLQIGDGPEREMLMEMASREGLSDSITFAGRRRDIPTLLGTIDIWVMSSIREGLPVALLEAMAAAKPIVATDVGGIPDAVDDGVEALLVPAGRPEKLAVGIITAATDRSLAAGLAHAARGRAIRDYSIDAVARKIEAIYIAGLGV